MSRQAALSFDEQLLAAKRFIEQHDDFLVVSHVHPDGDAASSTFAMGLMLRQLHKKYTLINEDKIPEKFSYLRGSDEVLEFGSQIRGGSPAYRHIITVDCADYERIGEVARLFAPQALLLNIDHHPTNDYFGSVQLIKPDAAATAEILYDLGERLSIRWDVDLATCIYTGLLTDTGGFRYSNTSPKVMNIAAKLLGYGVNGPRLAEDLLEKLTFSHIQMLKKALSTLSFTPDKRIAWISVSLEEICESGASNEDLEGLVNYPRNVEGVEVGILFKQTDEQTTKVSFRSAGIVDVSAVAKELGGGGHKRAAGCTVLGPFEKTINDIVTLLGKVLG